MVNQRDQSLEHTHFVFLFSVLCHFFGCKDGFLLFGTRNKQNSIKRNGVENVGLFISLYVTDSCRNCKVNFFFSSKPIRFVLLMISLRFLSESFLFDNSQPELHRALLGSLRPPSRVSSTVFLGRNGTMLQVP